MEKEAIAAIRERIAAACIRSRRSPGDVRLIAVTKGRTVERVQAVLKAGLSDIGENKVQEALLKYGTIVSGHAAAGINWHMIGHLQSNKVKQAVRMFELIHSVDSVSLGREIDRRAAEAGKVQDVLIEVKTSDEEAKYGVAPADALEAVRLIAALEHVRVRGLMTVAPAFGRAEDARPFFRQLRLVRDRINAAHVAARPLVELSMGMSDDFEVAIEEGATMVRVGRALFDYGRK